MEGKIRAGVKYFLGESKENINLCRNQLNLSMITKYVDPKNDFAFKRIFGSEKNKDILIALLNDVFSSQLNSKIERIGR